MQASFPRYRRAEQRADGVIHLIGLSLAVPAAAILLVLAGSRQVIAAVGAAVYAAALLLTLSLSAMYNLAPSGPRKELLRRFDHAAIFVMIAGTYTGFVLSRMADRTGAGLLAAVWIVALAGAGLKLLFPRRHERVALCAYLLLGWSFLPVAEDVFAALPPAALVLLLAGGLAYTAGALIHTRERLPYHNALWHALVLIGAGCHYAGILLCLTI